MSVDLIDHLAVLEAVAAVAPAEPAMLELEDGTVMPGEVAAARRVQRAQLELRLRNELGLSTWGAAEAARRITDAAVLEVLSGITDQDTLAQRLGTSPATLTRDRALVRRLQGGGS